jgi:hypothetical protein
VVAVGFLLGLSACTNPDDPFQRMIGGGLIGALAGLQSGLALRAVVIESLGCRATSAVAAFRTSGATAAQ